MPKQQVNVRLSEATRLKLDELTTVYGTQVEAMAVAIHHLHTIEKGRLLQPQPEEPKYLLTCEECGKTQEWDGDGLPEWWHSFALAFPHEYVVYTAPDGKDYNVEPDHAMERSHIVICPQCHARLFPWV